MEVDVAIASQSAESVVDAELEQFLRVVYVDEGFTPPELAASLFSGAAVRARGEIVVARDRASGCLVGMVIVVPPMSPACRVATAEEGEIHLLAVLREHRRSGVASRLMRKAMELAALRGFHGLALSTQPSMHAAHRLYESLGFQRDASRDWSRNGLGFLAYEIEVESRMR